MLNLLSIAAAYGSWSSSSSTAGGSAGRLRVRRAESIRSPCRVRDPLRAVDGLPRLHPSASRGIRQGHEHRRRDRPRGEDDRGVVTSAAIMMVGVFAIFATLSMMISSSSASVWRRRSSRATRPRDPPASVDEAARRLAWPAEVAPVAAALRTRRHHRGGARGATHTPALEPTLATDCPAPPVPQPGGRRRSPQGHSRDARRLQAQGRGRWRDSPATTQGMSVSSSKTAITASSSRATAPTTIALSREVSSNREGSGGRLSYLRSRIRTGRCRRRLNLEAPLRAPYPPHGADLANRPDRKSADVRRLCRAL